MTMTDTEAKALALVNEVVRERGYTNEPTPITREYCTDEALCRAIERLEAAEARHAAELREQAERFSGVVTDWFGRYSAEVPPQFQPFILPAPDPLVEALEAAVKAYIAEHGIEAFKALPMFGSAKIEGARLAIEAAATVAPSKTPSGECETVGQWTRRTLREAIRALDPAKIVGEG